MTNAELEKMAQELYDGFMDGKYRPVGMQHTSKKLDLVEAIFLALRTVHDVEKCKVDKLTIALKDCLMNFTNGLHTDWNQISDLLKECEK
jgi:hypothetical protein